MDVVADKEDAVDSSDSRPDGSEGYDWLFDPEAWIPVPEITNATVSVADVSNLKWPGFVWQDCGAGCKVSPFDLGPLEVRSNINSTSVRVVGGEWIGSFTLTYPFPQGKGIITVMRVSLETSKVWGAAQVRSTPPASIWMLFSDAARLFTVHPFTPVDRVFGLLPRTPGDQILWAKPDLPLGSDRKGFDFDATWHWGMVVDHQTVRVAEKIDSTELTTVHSGSYIPEFAVGGSSLYWTDCEYPKARLWGWPLGGQVEVLASGPWHASAIAASDDRIAWLAAQGNETCSGSFDSAALYWSPRADGQPLDPQGPIPVPTRSWTSMAVNTSWGAVLGEQKETTTVIITRLSDGKKWEIPPREPTTYSVVASLRGNELLTLESNKGPTADMQRMTRHDLTKLDQYATPIP
jgi:hypothetical protein